MRIRIMTGYRGLLREAADDVPVRPCLRSGMCCKKGPCAFGQWQPELGQCAHLLVERTLPNGAEIHACALHDWIAQQPGADLNPAFGAGCCMPLFNSARDRIVAALRVVP